jgi:hypothetical protein
MTKYFLFMILSACFVLLILPAFAAASSDHGDRVCIYKHDNFQGHEQCYRPGEEVSDLKNVDINSVRVFGHARVMLFEDRDFHGRMMEFSSDMPNLSRVAVSGSKSWHDHVGSLRVVPEVAFFDRDRDRFYDREHYPYGDTYIYRSKPTLETINEGVCVYEKPGFEGRSQCWSANTDISDLSFANWKDKIASVRVFGHARLVGYKDTEFHGDRIVIDHDAADLGTLPMARAGNWNHEIRSLAVQLEP